MKRKQTHKINNMDVIKWAKEYDGPLFHALLTDSPYNLDTITKRFGKNGSAPAKFGTDGVFSRSSKGFMNQDWDSDVAFQPETWRLMGEHLYPGAFCMSFGGTRTYHRMATAIEQAGFILHPMIVWIQFQGFPKSHGVKGDARFKGYKYGLQALKPACEPIVVFQKPYEGRPLDNIAETGAGVLNIDDTRIPTTDSVPLNQFDDGMKPFGNGAGHTFTSKLNTQGRYPSNVLLDTESAKALDAQTGELTSGLMKQGTVEAKVSRGIYGQYGKKITPADTYADSGGGSRFFKIVEHQMEENDPFCYVPKVSTKERNAGLDKRNEHPTLKPINLNTYLAKLLLPPSDFPDRKLLVPFSGAASEMIGGLLAGWDYVEGIELGKEYCKIGEARIKYWKGKK